MNTTMQRTLAAHYDIPGTPREALVLYIGGIAGFGFLAGLMPLANLLNSPVGLFVAFAAALGATLFMHSTFRQGMNPVAAALRLMLVGALAFLILYGFMWYFLTYLPSSPSLVQLDVGTAYHSP